MKDFLRYNNFYIISIGAVPAAIIRWKIDQILIANIIGCFLLGFIHSLPLSRRYKLIFGFGFCGSLTSFSGWSYQLFKLITEGLYKLFFFEFNIFCYVWNYCCCFRSYVCKENNKLV